MKLETFLKKRGYEIDSWDDLISDEEKEQGVVSMLAVFEHGVDDEPDFLLYILKDGKIKFGALTATMGWKLNEMIFELADLKKVIDSKLKPQNSK